MSINFLTFGGPSKNYHDAVNRICNQAREFNLFDKINGYTDKDLINEIDFYNKHKKFIIKNKRGYGYWIWKSYLINKHLKFMNDNDILIYLDCGCELNINGRKKLLDFINLVKTKYILCGKTISNDVTYSKMDLIKFMGMENDIKKLRLNHMECGTLMICKNQLTSRLFEEFYELCSNNYHLIDDSPSVEKNFDEFIEHRHDQSIFNLLLKKNNIINYDLYPTYWGIGLSSKDNYLNNALEYPIWSCRNKKGKSILE
jgi:hypothetical protein